MKPPKKSRTYAFIDNQNLNVSTQNIGWKMDWQKFRRFLTNKHDVDKAFMFIGYVPEFEDMYQFLHDAGYIVVLKPTYDMTRPRPEEGKDAEKDKKRDEEKKLIKGNVDVELVLWAVKEMENYDKAIVVSSDGDFYSLVEYLHDQDKLARLLVPSWQYSGLFNRFDSYIERIDKHRRELEYKPKRRFSRRKQ